MTDLACGASVTLTPYPYGTYMWDVISSGNVNLHFQSGTNSNSVSFTFTGDDHGWLRMDAYFDGSPHPTIEYRISADCGRSSPENLIIAYPNPVSGILTQRAIFSLSKYQKRPKLSRLKFANTLYSMYYKNRISEKPFVFPDNFSS